MVVEHSLGGGNGVGSRFIREVDPERR